MNRLCAYKLLCKQLKNAKIDSALLDAKLIICDVLNISKEELILNWEADVAETDISKIESFGNRRSQNEPMAYILGYKDFWKHKFIVSQDTLIPRPDSEIGIEAALEFFSQNHPETILDLGTGTGCLILSLLHEFPHSCGIAVDISLNAIDIASKNAELLKLSDRIEFIKSNWTKELKKQTFDLILCNPPYINPDDRNQLSSNVIDFEPETALFAEDEGLAHYEYLSKSLLPFCHSKTLLLFEIGENQENSVIKFFTKNSFVLYNMYRDLQGKSRWLAFQLTKV